MSYDSTDEVVKHTGQVLHMLSDIAEALVRRGIMHDRTKLMTPEKEAFDAMIPRLRNWRYGSEGYKACLKDLGSALQHHYECNRHHPEHFEDGINGMTLLDLIEMLVDWKACNDARCDFDFLESLKLQKERFGISGQLWNVLVNTAIEFGNLGRE